MPSSTCSLLGAPSTAPSWTIQTFEAAASQQVRSLSIGSAGRAVLSAGTLKVGDGTSVSPLTISPAADAAGGALDLVDQALVVQPSPEVRNITLEAVRLLIAEGSDGGRWDGAWIPRKTGLFPRYATARSDATRGNAAGTITGYGTGRERSDRDLERQK